MALIEFNDDVEGRHPWDVLNTQRSEVKTPYCVIFCNLTAMNIENDQIINSAESDAAVDTTYVVV
jgi:hypothetical protein